MGVWTEWVWSLPGVGGEAPLSGQRATTVTELSPGHEVLHTTLQGCPHPRPPEVHGRPPHLTDMTAEAQGAGGGSELLQAVQQVTARTF